MQTNFLFVACFDSCHLMQREVMKMKNVDTESAAAELAGIAPRTLTNARYRGTPHLPYFRVGSSVRYRKADVEAFILKQIEANTPKEKAA